MDALDYACRVLSMGVLMAVGVIDLSDGTIGVSLININ